MDWVSIDDVVVEEYELANIVDVCHEIGTPVFDGDVAPI